MPPCRATLFALCALGAACTPPDFPENPFVATEQDLVAPEVVPLDTGFPGDADLALAREAEAEAFALSEEAQALRERRAELAARDPARSGTQAAPDASADLVQGRAESLRDRAAELRGRQDVGQPEDAAALGARREEIDAEAETLRGRSD